MSLLNGRINFKVQASNISSVASFISELDKSSIILSANNCNDIYYNSSNALSYSYDTSKYNKAISLNIYENGQVIKPIVLSDEKIFLNSNVNIDGNLIPVHNIINDLGSSNFLWKDIYLSGNTITIGDTKLSSTVFSGDLTLKNSSNSTSNNTSALITNRFNIMIEQNTSNFSSVVCQDDGIRLEYLDASSNIIKSFPLGIANTSIFTEGSNEYYTTERYETWFSKKNNLDFINDGTSNRFILNDVYDGDLNVMKLLTVGSNITVSGDTTVIDTIVYQMNNMYISNPDTNTALSITQNSIFDILKICNSNNTAMYIGNNTFTGINNENPNYNLDVSGTLNATTFIGDTSLFNNLYLEDKSTSYLLEASNLYFTHHRVDEIVSSSNLRASNYIIISSNIISVIMTDTSNIISNRLTETSNLITDRLSDTSNLISNRLTETSNIITDRLSDTSNLISSRISNISNIISDKIYLLNTNVIPENLIPDNLYYTSNRYDERLLSKTLDNFYDGTSNRYIINNTYDRDLYLNGSLYASNLNVVGSITSLATYTFQTENMTISTDSDHDVSLSIRQTNTSNSQILAVTNMGGDGLYVYTCNLNDNHKGFIGINNSNPLYELDINGIARSTIFQGDASQMYNVNLSSINTSYIKETSYSNLYFTHERAGTIIHSSNTDSSNYVSNSFTDISSHFATTSNTLYTTLNSDNTTISTRITNLNTNEIAENPSFLYYTTERYDDRLLTKTTDFIHDGTSNKFIINNKFVGDLSFSSNLYASNLNIVGNSTVFNTTTYLTSNLNIATNDTETLPSLKIRQNGIYDIFELVDDTATVLKIKNGGNVGIMTSTPVNTLDINGIARSSMFIGDASQEFFVNLLDRDTGLLREGVSSNLYYTAYRTGELLYSSNENASNYMINSHSDILNKTTETSNILSQSLNNLLSVRIANTCNILIDTSNQVYNMTLETSNTLINVINDILEIQIVDTNHKLLNMATVAENSIIFTSNLLKTYLDNVVSNSISDTAQKLINDSNYLMTNIYNTSNIISQTLENIISVQIRDINKFVDDSSNQINSDINNTSNYNANRIFNLTTSEILEASNLYFNDVNFMLSLHDIRTLDNITSNDNTSNKYITNDVYNSSLELGGSLLVSNLSAVGTFTTLNTNVFQTENMIIDSSTDGPALKITQNYNDCNIFETYDDSDIVMMINKDGLIGIKTDTPVYELDILGTLNTTYFAGDTSMTSNIYLIDRNTSILIEGSNLYYTAFRTGTILFSSNQDTSNYTLNTSNDLARELTSTSNVSRQYIQNISNITTYDTKTQSIIDDGSLGKFDYLYFTEKYTSNSMSIFENKTIEYNTSNLIFIGGNVGTSIVSIFDSTNLQFYYKFDSDYLELNSGLLGTSYNLVNSSNILPLLTDNVYGTSSVQFTDNSNILYTPNYDFATTFDNSCTISYWLKKTGINTSNDTIISGYNNDDLIIRRDNTTSNWYYNIFGNSSFNNIIMENDYIADNIWGHYAWIAEKSGAQTKITVYKDASLIYTDTSGTWTPPNTAISFSNSSNSFIGAIDDFRIYNIALTSNDIVNLNIISSPYLNNLRYDVYTYTSNIPKIEASTISILSNYLQNTSNTAVNNFNSRTYTISSTSNEIATFNTISSNQNTALIINNSNTFASNLAITSNLLAIYTELTSNNLAIGIRTTSNILQEYSILSSNQYNTHNTISSNYIINYLDLSSNTISANITYNDITTTEQFINSSNTNFTNFINSSNELGGFWSNVAIVSMENMILASNILAPIILDNSNIISNRIQALTLDEIHDGGHHQYIVNNVFNSNLSIPHNLVVASLLVQDIDMYMTNDNNDIPNQQLRAYVTEITSNAIIQYIQARQ